MICTSSKPTTEARKFAILMDLPPTFEIQIVGLEASSRRPALTSSDQSATPLKGRCMISSSMVIRMGSDDEG